jgi:O-antigen/teichoic acid export membrane protein
MESIRKQQSWVLMDQALYSGTSFLLTIILAKILSIENFGLYSGYLLGIHLLIGVIGAFVIQPFQVLLGSYKKKSTYIAFSFWLQVVVLVLICFLAACIVQVLGLNFPLQLFLLATGFVMHDFGRKLLLATNSLLHTILLDILTLLSLSLALFSFHLSPSKELADLFQVLGIAYFLPFLVILTKINPFKFRKRIYGEFLVRHVKEGKWLFFTAISQWWSSNLFVVASGIYLGPPALGALRLAQSLMGVLNILLQSFENHALPQAATLFASKDNSGLLYLTDLSRKAAFLFLPMLCAVFIFAEKLMVLAGGEAYRSYAFVLQGVTILYVLIFLSQPIRLTIRALILNRHFFIGYLISLSFSLIFSKYLLSNFGLQGAIAGLMASQILLIAYWTIVLQKQNIHLWKSFISS